MKTADGFDDAIAGIIRQFNQPAKVVYDYGKCLEILQKRDGMTHDEAIEFMEFNVVGAYVGEDTPAWMMPYNEVLVEYYLEEEEEEALANAHEEIIKLRSENTRLKIENDVYCSEQHPLLRFSNQKESDVFVKNVRLALSWFRLNQSELARLLGTSRQTVSQWLHKDYQKRTNPSPEHLELIAKHLQTKIADLFNE